jgi:DNA-binding Lrp family transcriptional regulator
MDEKLLLEILQKDARISTANLAKMLNSSEKDVEKKIEELKKSGAIKAFKTYVDWEKTGDESITAYIEVKVASEAKAGFSDIGNQLAADDKVEEVCVTSGEYDFTIKIRAKNIKEVSNFVTEILAPKQAVIATATHFVLKKFKENGVAQADGAADKLVISA